MRARTQAAICADSQSMKRSSPRQSTSRCRTRETTRRHIGAKQASHAAQATIVTTSISPRLDKRSRQVHLLGMGEPRDAAKAKGATVNKTAAKIAARRSNRFELTGLGAPAVARPLGGSDGHGDRVVDRSRLYALLINRQRARCVRLERDSGV